MNHPRPLEIPPLYCPFPYRGPHPAIERVNEAGIAWFRDFVLPEVGGGILDRWRREYCAGVGAWYRPYGDEDGVQVYGDWVLFTLIDEGFDGPGGIMDAERLAAFACHMVRVAECPDQDILPKSGWAGVLRDIVTRLRRMGATPTQLVWLAEALRTYAHGVAWENSCRHSQVMPTLDEYALMRLWAGGMLTYNCFYPMIDGYELTQEERASPAFRAISEMAALLASWDNDLFSQFKDVTNSSFVLNLIDVCAHAGQISPQQAVPVAVALRDRVMSRYLWLSQEVIRQGASESMHRYIHGLNCMLRGNIDYSARTTRYLNPYDKPADQVPWLTLPLETTNAPSIENPDPPGLPNIDWWWSSQLAAAPVGAATTCPTPARQSAVLTAHLVSAGV